MSFGEFIAANNGDITNVDSRVKMVGLKPVRDSNDLLNISTVFFIDNVFCGSVTIYAYFGKDEVTAEAFSLFQAGVRAESYRIFGDNPTERTLPGPKAANDFCELRWSNDSYTAFLGLPGKRSQMTRLELVGAVSVIETAYAHKARTKHSLDVLQLSSIMSDAAKFRGYRIMKDNEGDMGGR